jgi:hypothetical protein
MYRPMLVELRIFDRICREANAVSGEYRALLADR